MLFKVPGNLNLKYAYSIVVWWKERGVGISLQDGSDFNVWHTFLGGLVSSS